MGKKCLILLVMLLGLYGTSYGQSTPGTVSSKTLDGVGNKITSTTVGLDQGLDIVCISGCGAGGGTQDVNIIQILGVAPSETNPFPNRLSTGVAYYDARDRNWALASGTDSVTAVITNLDVALSTRSSEATLLGVLTTTAFQARINTLGQKTMAASTPVVLSSDQSAIPVTVLSTVATANDNGTCPSGAASFTVLASNASRTWAAIWASPANTDDVFVKLGATATSADARIAPGQPINFTSGRIYTGIIDALPASGTQAVCAMELN